MWLQAHLVVDKSRAAFAELLFESLGAVAVTLGDAGDEPMLEPGPGETPLWEATKVTGLYAGETDPEGLRSALNHALAADVSRSLTLEHIADRDWERAWLDRFAPMRFGRRLWIRPSGHEVTGTDAVIIDLDPGLAFGTGTHPTTALCLEWLDGHDLTNNTVIDFGSGSGVLAIASLKLGAREAMAIDHDPQAVVASRNNADRNGIGSELRVFHSGQFEPVRADLVIANILANVLIELSTLIGPLLRASGDLVLSGILRDQADAVMAAYRPYCRFSALVARDDWVLLHGKATTEQC